ncbi:hypothetical protein ACH6CV_01840 [Bacillota bacterium Meth-B3]
MRNDKAGGSAGMAEALVFFIIATVRLSNMLDSEGSEDLLGETPGKRAHREVVGAGLVSSELLTEVSEGEEAVGGIETLLVLPVAAFDLVCVFRRT